MTGDVTPNSDPVDPEEAETALPDDEDVAEVTSFDSPLAKASALFEAGANAKAKQLLESIPDSEDAAVLRQRDHLLKKIAPDRVALIVSGVCFVIVMVVFFFATHRS